MTYICIWGRYGVSWHPSNIINIISAAVGAQFWIWTPDGTNMITDLTTSVSVTSLQMWRILSGIGFHSLLHRLRRISSINKQPNITKHHIENRSNGESLRFIRRNYVNDLFMIGMAQTSETQEQYRTTRIMSAGRYWPLSNQIKNQNKIYIAPYVHAF